MAHVSFSAAHALRVRMHRYLHIGSFYSSSSSYTIQSWS